MNDKIEIGEYVRTDEGILGKFLRIERDDIDASLKWYILYAPKHSISVKGEVYTNKPYIAKHSKNIIDLIEVGDYVNGHLVIDKKDDEGRIEIAIESDHIICYWIEEKDIKSIVTKEQFKQVQYEV